jgi:hypothetical protein
MRAQLNYVFGKRKYVKYTDVKKPVSEIRIPCMVPGKGFGQIRLFLTSNIGDLLVYRDVDPPRPV